MIMPSSILMKILLKSRNVFEITEKEYLLLTAPILMCFRSNGKNNSNSKINAVYLHIPISISKF